jgi:plasmid stabilization system protein ParE
MSRILLSKLAEADLDQIDRQTIDRFGLNQAAKTLEAFWRATRDLADHPDMGHRREDLDPPRQILRCWPVLKRFLIVYRPMQDGIEVARILDGSRELKNVLFPPSGD